MEDCDVNDYDVDTSATDEQKSENKYLLQLICNDDKIELGVKNEQAQTCFITNN